MTKRSPMKESSKARFACMTYIGLGPERTLQNTAAALNRNTTLLYRWSIDFDWLKKAKEYDDYVNERALAAAAKTQIKEIEKRRLSRLKVYNQARDKGLMGLEALLKKDLKTNPSVVVRLLDYADKGERLDLGESTERTTIQGPEGQPMGLIVNVTEIPRAGADKPTPPSLPT